MLERQDRDRQAEDRWSGLSSCLPGILEQVQAAIYPAKHIKEETAIPIPEIKALSPVTKRGDVVQGTSELEAKRPCLAESAVQHGKRIDLPHGVPERQSL